MKFKVEEIRKGFAPIRFNKFDAGFDVMSRYDVCIPYLKTIVIQLGFKIYIEPGWEMQIRDRSHIVIDTPLRVSDAPATIDAGYIQEVTCTLSNIISSDEISNYSESIYRSEFGDEGFMVSKGDRIAQVVFKEIPAIEFDIVDDVKQSAEYKRKIDNSKQGLGSTGIKHIKYIDSYK